MKRWNGWGETSIDYPLHASAIQYLADHLGAGVAPRDVSLEQALTQVPPAQIQPHPLVRTDPLERLLHSRGHSLPDWVALRTGNVSTHPEGVAYPDSNEDVRSMLAYAHQTGIRLIPYGGGTSVVGHINPLPKYGPCVSVDLSHLNQLFDLDHTSRLATVGAGMRGPELEAQLNRLGYTAGHFPQSFDYSTVGGWVATRSSGQQSVYYGRIEDLFAGGHLETPIGSLDLPAFPASAAGPDIRQIVLGSEGRLGILTQAVLRVKLLPHSEAFYGIFFKDWSSGMQAVREIVQSSVGVSMLRFSDPYETETTLVLSGKDRLASFARQALQPLGYNDERSLLVLGITGESITASQVKRQAMSICRRNGGLVTGQLIGKLWAKNRFRAPYLRNTLWEQGYAVDTLETALPWSKVPKAAQAIRNTLLNGLDTLGERVIVFSHLSHVYSDGASIYTTYLFRLGRSAEETLLRWQVLKTAASQEIVAHGGTISHQHGVGIDHAPYMVSEKGTLGISLLESACKTLDPGGILNPGKLLPSVN